MCILFLVSVILSIRRHHYEQVKVAVPVIVNVLKFVTSETDDGDTEIEGLFDRAVGIANSIHTVCTKLVCDIFIYYISCFVELFLATLYKFSIRVLTFCAVQQEGKSNEKLCALLGLYVLEIMVGISLWNWTSSLNIKMFSFMLQLEELCCLIVFNCLFFFHLLGGLLFANLVVFLFSLLMFIISACMCLKIHPWCAGSCFHQLESKQSKLSALGVAVVTPLSLLWSIIPWFNNWEWCWQND